MIRFVKWICLLSICVCVASAQPSLTDIYNSLEYRTDEFNDIKRAWLITDSKLVRDIFIRFNRDGYIHSNGRMLDGQQAKAVLDEIYDGRTLVVVTQRIFDDELESLVFLSSSGIVIDTLKDWTFLQTVLARPNDTYSVIKAKQYPSVDLSKEVFNSDQRFSYDLYLHILEPRILLWHTVSRTVKTRSEISFFGRLGNDYLNTPFWFKGTFVYGLRYAFVENVRSVGRDNDKFSVYAGVETPINFSGRHEDATSRTSIFKDRKLEASGFGIVVGTSYTPFPYISFSDDPQEKMEFGLEVALAVSKREAYPVNVDTAGFYSIRNSVTLYSKLKNVGNFYFSAGASAFDVYRYKPTPALPERLTLLEPKEIHCIPFANVGIREDGDLFGYDIGATLNYDFTGSYKFLVTKALFTLSNTFGVEVRYFRALNIKNLPPWQDDNYLAISPILRINY